MANQDFFGPNLRIFDQVSDFGIDDPRRFFAVFCTFLYVIVVLIGVLKGQKLVAKGELSISILTFESEN